ncbi:YbaY family lipoprotein [Pseudomonas sp. LRF_L74]|uniref:YbaY family lipoprotein n=1 Tax=Pseudomonas sp. LRF_L74 TaxID=3369422 RepID=UPI003F60AF78
MSLRLIALSSLLVLLSACASTEEPQPKPAEPVKSIKLPESSPTAFFHELQGKLLGVPAKAEVELALLQVDERGRPQKLIASVILNGTGTPLPFRLGFNPKSFAQGQRVELRGRASQSGQLILHLPARTIQSADSQSLGELQFVPAP